MAETGGENRRQPRAGSAELNDRGRHRNIIRLKQKQNPHDRRRDQQQPDHSYPIKSLFLEDIQQLGFGDKHADADHCQRRVHIRQKAHHRLERIRQLQGKQQQRQADIDPDGSWVQRHLPNRDPFALLAHHHKAHRPHRHRYDRIDDSGVHHPPVAQNLLNHGKAHKPAVGKHRAEFQHLPAAVRLLIKAKFYDDHRG